MKRFLAIFALLIFSFFSLSCEKETILSVDQTSITIPDTGGSKTVSLTTNKPWTASSNQSWCKVSPSAGEEASSSRITITCDANTSYDARNASVTFTCAEKTVSVNVSQATNNGLIVSQTEYNITNAAQQLEIKVQANVKFSVEVDNGCKDWVKYNTTKGLSNSTVVLDIAKNDAYDGREGKVTIKQTDGNLSSTVVIKQGQQDGMFLTTSEYNLSNEKHTLTVEVKSNIEFEVKPEVDWIKYVETKGLKTNQIILDIAENDTYDDREGKVIVKQNNGDLTGIITVKQDEKYGILVSQSEYELSNEAQTIDVEVKYNVDYSVVIPSICKDWIKQVSVKSLNSRTYTFSIAKNATYDNREGSITFKEKNGNSSTTVSIKQAQTDYLEVSKKDFTVDIEGETIEIEVKSNVDYAVSISDDAQSWLSIVETKGISTDKVLVAVSPGNDDTDRIGKIVICFGNLSRTVSVHQYSYAAKTLIHFLDAKIKAKLVEAFDSNKDGEISIKEARAVKTIDGVFGAVKTYKSFDEFQYFTSVSSIPKGMFSEWNSFSSIILPESIEEIGIEAFYKCEKLERVNLPKGVKTIGYGAFSNCGHLKVMDIPESVTIIDNNTFSGCSSLQSVTCPGAKIIGYGAFSGCSMLTSIVLPEKMDSIGDYSFCNCSKLSVFQFPSSVEYVGESAFYGCSCFPSSLILPENLSSIGKQAFYGCSNLSSITFPRSEMYMGEEAFYSIADHVQVISRLYRRKNKYGNEIAYPGYYLKADSIDWIMLNDVPIIEGGFFQGFSLTSIVISNSVKAIDYYAFSKCKQLKKVVIPDSVSKMGEYAFSECESLTSVVYPESMSFVPEGCFDKCNHLTSITLPECVTSIGNKAFSDCSGLQSIIIRASTPPYYVGRNSFDNTNNCPIYVPKESVDVYKSTGDWKKYANRIKAIQE